MTTLSQVVVSAGLDIDPLVTASFTGPRAFFANSYLNYTGNGGLAISGAATISVHAVKLQMTMSGGLSLSGHFAASYGGHMYVTPTGQGLSIGGLPTLKSFTRAFTPTGGMSLGGAADISTFTPAVIGNIAAKLPPMKMALVVAVNKVATITATLPAITSSMSGGHFYISAALPSLTSSINAHAGNVASISAKLAPIDASLTAIGGVIGGINALLPSLTSSVSSVAGLIATIDADLPSIRAAATGVIGKNAAITSALPALRVVLTGGVSVIGSISSTLPAVASAITVLAQATVQQLTMVVGTHNNVLSTYENFPFNSFCELNGVYYAAGPAGFCQIDVGDLDDAAKINAGLSTGLMQFGEPHLKRISDAYMTLRTAGNLTLTITVDEGTPVVLTMSAQEFATFIQRRIITPKGLKGKSWQFEINNVDGTDFDFGQLGFNVAVSARRIGR